MKGPSNSDKMRSPDQIEDKDKINLEGYLQSALEDLAVGLRGRRFLMNSIAAVAVCFRGRSAGWTEFNWKWYLYSTYMEYRADTGGYALR